MPGLEPEPDKWLNVSGLSVPLWLRGDPSLSKRVVILSHGLTNDHRDAPLFDDLRTKLSADGSTVLVDFDYPGSGIADGEFEDKRFSSLRESLIAVARYVRDRFPHLPVSAIGRSIGATVLLSVYPQICPSRLAVMSPPFELVANLGSLRGEPLADGFHPLPSWAQPSGQVKGRTVLSDDFYEELPEEEERLREAVAEARNVLLISSTEDPKVPAAEMDALWDVLSNNETNSRAVWAADHNYMVVKKQVTAMLTEWVRR